MNKKFNNSSRLRLVINPIDACNKKIKATQEKNNKIILQQGSDMLLLSHLLDRENIKNNILNKLANEYKNNLEKCNNNKKNLSNIINTNKKTVSQQMYLFIILVILITILFIRVIRE